jgi:hypothetical protein
MVIYRFWTQDLGTDKPKSNHHATNWASYFGSFGQKLGLSSGHEERMKLWDSTNWCFLDPMWCDLTLPCVGHVLKGVFCTCSKNRTLFLSLSMHFYKFQTKREKSQCKHHFPCDEASLCQIWVHLKNARSHNSNNTSFG